MDEFALQSIVLRFLSREEWNHLLIAGLHWKQAVLLEKHKRRQWKMRLHHFSWRRGMVVHFWYRSYPRERWMRITATVMRNLPGWRVEVNVHGTVYRRGEDGSNRIICKLRPPIEILSWSGRVAFPWHLRDPV